MSTVYIGEERNPLVRVAQGAAVLVLRGVIVVMLAIAVMVAWLIFAPRGVAWRQRLAALPGLRWLMRWLESPAQAEAG